MRPSPLLLALPLLAACTTVPEAQVVGVRLDRQGTEGARLVATIRLKNATKTPMPMVGVEYRLKVEGAPDFAIDDSPYKTVPAVDAQEGLQEVELPAGIPTKAPLAGKKYHLEGTFTFEPDTDWRKLKTEMGIALPTRDFEASGVLEGPKPAADAPAAPPAPKQP